MRNLKSILPMLAFVLAIGMSFAVEYKAPEDNVLEINGDYYKSPIDCQGEVENCTTLIEIDGAVQEVQVLRETAQGAYEPVMTSAKNSTVFQFTSLTPVNP